MGLAVGAVVGGVISGNAFLSTVLCGGKNMLVKQSAAVRLFLNKSDIISGEQTEERKGRQMQNSRPAAVLLLSPA